MKIADISKYPDGTCLIRYSNGYIFEGYADDKNNPISGIITSPEKKKYKIPDFKDEDIFDVFEMIARGELTRYIIKT